MTQQLHFLVTAGSTREKIDQVRDWGNIFTGKTGVGYCWLSVIGFGATCDIADQQCSI